MVLTILLHPMQRSGESLSASDLHQALTGGTFFFFDGGCNRRGSTARSEDHPRVPASRLPGINSSTSSHNFLGDSFTFHSFYTSSDTVFVHDSSLQVQFAVRETPRTQKT